MSGAFSAVDEETGDAYRTWRRNTPVILSQPLEGDTASDITMSDICPKDVPSNGTKKNTSEQSGLDHNHIPPVSVNQETTFTEGTSPENNVIGDFAESKNIKTQYPSKSNSGSDRVLDSKGGPQFRFPPRCSVPSIGTKTPYRFRTTSWSSDAASITSISSQGSIIELSETPGSGRSRSSISSCTTTSMASIASGPQIGFKQDELSTSLTQTTDSAIDVEGDAAYEDFPSEAQPLLFGEEDHQAMQTGCQDSVISLPPLQESRETQIRSDLETNCRAEHTSAKCATGVTSPSQYKHPALSISTNMNTPESCQNVKSGGTRTPSFAPEPIVGSLACEKENKDPGCPNQEAGSLEVETPPQVSNTRPLQAATSPGDPKTREPSYNLESVLGYRTPLSQNEVSLPSNKHASPPVLQVLVPVLRKTTTAEHVDKSGKKNGTVRKKEKGSIRSSTLSSSITHNSNLPSPSNPDSQMAAASTAATSTLSPSSTTIHHLPYSESCKNSTEFNKQHPSYLYHTIQGTEYLQQASPMDNHVNNHHNQENISHAQGGSFDPIKDHRASAGQQTQSGHGNMNQPVQQPSHTDPDKCHMPHSLSQVPEPNLNTTHQSKSPSWQDTQDPRGSNQGKGNMEHILNTKFMASATPNFGGPMLFPKGPQNPAYNDSYINNMNHSDDNESNMTQNNTFVEIAPFLVETQEQHYQQQQQQQQQHQQQQQAQSQQPYYKGTFMPPYNHHNVYPYGYAPSWACSVIYGGIPGASQPPLRPGHQSGDVYPRYHPTSFQPHWMPGVLPQHQYHTTPLSAPLASGDSTMPTPSSQKQGFSLDLDGIKYPEGYTNAQKPDGSMETCISREPFFPHSNPHPQNHSYIYPGQIQPNLSYTPNPIQHQNAPHSHAHPPNTLDPQELFPFPYQAANPSTQQHQLEASKGQGHTISSFVPTTSQREGANDQRACNQQQNQQACLSGPKPGLELDSVKTPCAMPGRSHSRITTFDVPGVIANGQSVQYAVTGLSSGETIPSDSIEVNAREIRTDTSNPDRFDIPHDRTNDQTSGRASVHRDLDPNLDIERGLGVDPSDASGSEAQGVEGCAAHGEPNRQEGPVPTVVADRRESLPSSIHSDHREAHSTNSQMPFLKDRRDIFTNPPSSCYKSLCILATIVNPVVGLVALLLLFLAEKKYERQRFTCSSHLQLASIILATCGIFISLNIIFLLAVPWAVRVGSPIEIVHVVGSNRQRNQTLTEKCLESVYGDHDRFLQDYHLDKESYCLVVTNLKLKEALNAHLVHDRLKEREQSSARNDIAKLLGEAPYDEDDKNSMNNNKSDLDTRPDTIAGGIGDTQKLFADGSEYLISGSVPVNATYDELNTGKGNYTAPSVNNGSSGVSSNVMNTIDNKHDDLGNADISNRTTEKLKSPTPGPLKPAEPTPTIVTAQPDASQDISSSGSAKVQDAKATPGTTTSGQGIVADASTDSG